jgi:hypothetical protein
MWFYYSFYKFASKVLIWAYNNSMIAKAWNYFVNKISKKEEPQVLLPFSRHPLPAIARLTFSLMDRPQQGQQNA